MYKRSLLASLFLILVFLGSSSLAYTQSNPCIATNTPSSWQCSQWETKIYVFDWPQKGISNVEYKFRTCTDNSCNPEKTNFQIEILNFTFDWNSPTNENLKTFLMPEWQNNIFDLNSDSINTYIYIMSDQLLQTIGAEYIATLQPGTPEYIAAQCNQTTINGKIDCEEPQNSICAKGAKMSYYYPSCTSAAYGVHSNASGTDDFYMDLKMCSQSPTLCCQRIVLFCICENQGQVSNYGTRLHNQIINSCTNSTSLPIQPRRNIIWTKNTNCLNLCEIGI